MLRRTGPLFVLFLVISLGWAAGSPAQEFVISNPAGAGNDVQPDVVYGNGQFFTVWTRANSIYGTRVLQNGTVLDPAGIKLPEYWESMPGVDSRPTVSFDGTNFVAAYQASVFDFGCSMTRMRSQILAARVSGAGVVLDAAAREIYSKCTIGGNLFSPDLDWDGQNFLLVYGDFGLFIGSSARGARVTPGLGVTLFPISDPVGEELDVSLADTAVAFDGWNYLAVWSDRRDMNSYRIFGARVTPSGTVLDPGGIAITAAGSPGDHRPAVAFGTTRYLVVWERSGTIRAARVTTGGGVLDPGGFPIASGTQPAVAYDGSNFLVVWSRSSPAGVYGAVVSQGGSVSTPWAISTPGVAVAAPALAFDGSRYLAVWERWAGAETSIYGTFVCDDGNVCTDNVLHPTQGCVFVNNTAACDDGNACTTNDTCSGGVCVGGPPLNCDDGNPCTDNWCNPAVGCVSANNTAPCDDGNACTTNDTCSGGVCVGGPPLACDDGNVCTDNTCDPAVGCVFVNNTAPCDDGNACTTNDTCAGGVCVGGPPLACDDGNVCTDNTCDPAAGCVFVNNTAPCDDGNACTTNDTCSGGVCVGGPPLACDDGNICTDDACDPAVGCVFVNNTAPCDDGNACTINDTCSGGVCVGGPPLACDDGNICTDNTCDPAVGCVFVNNTAPCDDGNACTTNDTCSGGVCVGGPPLDCDDGVFCNGEEWCDPVLGCQPGTPPDCDDGLFCNGEEYCDEELDLCVSPGNPCPDDGLWCTGVEFCLEEIHMCASTGNPCADGNPCTLEICFEEDRTCQYACNAMNWQDPCCQDPVCAGDPACDGGPGCFIATASFGTEMAGKIDRLRLFRDRVLLAGRVGTVLVDAYYRTSPPIAEFIRERPVLRAVVRMFLLPVVGLVSLFV